MVAVHFQPHRLNPHWSILMIKRVFTFFFIFFLGVASAQEEAKLPEFKTFLSFVNTTNRADISMSEVSGLSGRLKIGGDRCMFDEVVHAEKKGGDFIIKLDMKPRDPVHTAFCTIKVTITLPQKPGAFGSTLGTMEWVYASLNGRVAHAKFSFGQS